MEEVVIGLKLERPVHALNRSAVFPISAQKSSEVSMEVSHEGKPFRQVREDIDFPMRRWNVLNKVCKTLLSRALSAEHFNVIAIDKDAPNQFQQAVAHRMGVTLTECRELLRARRQVLSPYALPIVTTARCQK